MLHCILFSILSFAHFQIEPQLRPDEQVIKSYHPKKKKPYLLLFMPNGQPVRFEQNGVTKEYQRTSENRGYVSARTNINNIKVISYKKADSFQVVLGDGTRRLYVNKSKKKKKNESIYQLIEESLASGNQRRYLYTKKGELAKAVTYTEDFSKVVQEKAYGPKKKKNAGPLKGISSVWDQNKRLISISRADEKNKLIMKEEFTWADDGALIAHTIFDETATPVLSRTFSYDDRGNVLEEKLFGRFSENTGNIVLENGIPAASTIEMQERKNVSEVDQNPACDGVCEYDALNRVTKVYYPPIFTESGKKIVPVKRYEYKNLGMKRIETDENGFKKVTIYSVAGKILEEGFQDGTKRTFRYDANGKKETFNYNAMGILEKNSTPRFFDREDVVKESTYPGETTYDARGNLSAVKTRTDSGELATHKEFFYDAAGNRVLTREHKIVKGKSKEVDDTRMHYGPNRRLEKVVEHAGTSKEQTTVHRYNLLGQRSSTLLPNKERIEYRYDNNNRCTEQITYDKKGKEKKRKRV